jgi:hypothetical protein
MHGVHGHVVKDDSNESSFNMAPTYESPSSCEVMYEDDVFASSYVHPTKWLFKPFGKQPMTCISKRRYALCYTTPKGIILFVTGSYFEFSVAQDTRSSNFSPASPKRFPNSRAISNPYKHPLILSKQHLPRPFHLPPSFLATQRRRYNSSFAHHSAEY